MSWEGNLIKKRRKENGLTQQMLCEKIDIPKRTLEQWESGERTPPKYVAKLIQYYLVNEFVKNL